MGDILKTLKGAVKDPEGIKILTDLEKVAKGMKGLEIVKRFIPPSGKIYFTLVLHITSF